LTQFSVPAPFKPNFVIIHFLLIVPSHLDILDMKSDFVRRVYLDTTGLPPTGGEHWVASGFTRRVTPIPTRCRSNLQKSGAE
jgi:hypothetical protein